jgi:hypothetical protein
MAELAAEGERADGDDLVAGKVQAFQFLQGVKASF